MTFNPTVDYNKPSENENEHTKMLRMVSEMQKLWSEFALLLSKQNTKKIDLVVRNHESALKQHNRPLNSAPAITLIVWV
jgi:hypothetical protein